jgi:hypothetical protein
MGPANLSHPVILDHNDGRPNSPLRHVVAEKFYQLLKPGCKLLKTLHSSRQLGIDTNVETIYVKVST